MFVKNNDSGLVFIKSRNINAFPCGRRRSNLIDADGNNDTVSDKYYIPFDPEARLNTEANNRKHSGLNGFTQSYIQNWTSSMSDGSLRVVLDGYFFEIKLDYGYDTPALFGAALESNEYLGATNCIYANIKTANVKFFSGTATVPEAGTSVLRDQVLNDEPATCLDFIIDTHVDKNKADSYYFSGFSLSTEDKTNAETGVTSLQILTKANGVWDICNTSRLPKIAHGETKDSVNIIGDLAICATDFNTGSLSVAGNINAVGKITAASVEANRLTQNGHTATLLDIIPVEKETDKVYYQLKFTGAVEN